MKDLRSEAWQELAAKKTQNKSIYSKFDPLAIEYQRLEEERFKEEVEALARSRLNEALKKVGLA